MCKCIIFYNISIQVLNYFYFILFIHLYVCFRYSGPDSQRINDVFSIGFETYITTSRRVIHAWIDGRGSSNKGTAMMYQVYRSLGGAEMQDQISVTKWVFFRRFI